MDSKILFKNETTYTPEIAMEAGDAFWEIQPAYRKRAKRFRLGAGILAVTFALLAILVARENVRHSFRRSPCHGSNSPCRLYKGRAIGQRLG